MTISANNIPTEQDRSEQLTRTADWINESIYSVVYRHRWLVLCVVVMAIAAGFVYILKATPIYTSTSRIYVEQRGPSILSETQSVITQSKNYLYTQAEVLTSMPIITATLEKPEIKGLKTFTDTDNTAEYLQKNINVSVGKQNDIISIAFDSPYPQEAAALVNSIVDSYVTYMSSSQKSITGEVLTILWNEKDRLNGKLTTQLKELQEFRTNNPGLGFESKEGNIVIERLAQLSDALTQAQLRVVEASNELESTKLMIADPAKLAQFVEVHRSKLEYSPAASDSMQIKETLNTLNSRYTDLRNRLTDDHPSIISLKTKIDQVEKQIVDMDKNFAQSQLADAQERYDMEKAKEKEISTSYENQMQASIELNNQLAEYALLELNFEETKKLCDVLDTRISELSITEDTGALNINILEVAKVEDKPSKPQKERIMAMALVLGLMLGCASALLRDWSDKRIRSADEIMALLNVPIIGIVPAMSRKETVPQRGCKVLLELNSTIAEAYRTIRTAIFFGVRNIQVRTILITSPASGDGKSTLVSNLGIAMAQAGQRTLIVDADFRKPMQHTIFELTQEPGITNIIENNANAPIAIRQTKIANLSILTCGKFVNNPAEILNSDKFAAMLKEISLQFDRVIIDSPPVGHVTDAQILAAISDITILVLRAEKSTRLTSQEAHEALASVGARLVGAVVNDLNPKNAKYRYYSYGRYSGRYGYAHKEDTTAATS